MRKDERNFLKKIKSNDEIIYMWEDKGPSFTKMRTDQYISAGETELTNSSFYEEVPSDPSVEIKAKQDRLISDMLISGQITEKVAQHLVEGGSKLSNFYHTLKTHNLPVDEPIIDNWLQENGYPSRGIISGIQAPTERLSGFLDHFLQPGMKNLETFLQDTKHMLQLIEGVNEKIDGGEFSLEGVGLVTLDLEKMYNNITDELGMGAARTYLDARISQSGENYLTQDPKVSTNSLMTGL